MKIRLAVAEIQRDSIVDGEGIRSVIWTQGCTHHCVGCHNPETHSFQEGIYIDVEDLKETISKLEGQDGITFSGGDPMEQAEACSELAKFCKEKNLNVWCYTGYTWEELLQRVEYFPAIGEFLKYIDVLVDGKFELTKKSYDVEFRGSKNQRLIDVQKSLKAYKVVELENIESSFTTKKKESKSGRKNHYIYV